MSKGRQVGAPLRNARSLRLAAVCNLSKVGLAGRHLPVTLLRPSVDGRRYSIETVVSVISPAVMPLCSPFPLLVNEHIFVDEQEIKPPRASELHGKRVEVLFWT